MLYLLSKKSQKRFEGKKMLLLLILAMFSVLALPLYAADGTESCDKSLFGNRQYKPEGNCDTEERVCCSSSGKWSNWGEDCTCGEDECNVFGNCVERCNSGDKLSEAKSSKCSYHGTYGATCTYGPSSVCATWVTGLYPCRCDAGYTGSKCNIKVTEKTLPVAIQTVNPHYYTVSSMGPCDGLHHSYQPPYIDTYDCSSSKSYGSFSATSSSSSSDAINKAVAKFCESGKTAEAICKSKGAGYSCTKSVSGGIYWTNGWRESTAEVIICEGV